jgi:hypothetical protein
MWAQHWAKGLQLPEAGTIQDEILQEVYERKKSLDFAKVFIFVTIMQQIHSLPLKFISELLELYEVELSQETYAPSYIQKTKLKLKEKQKQQLIELIRKESAMATVAAMSDDE